MHLNTEQRLPTVGIGGRAGQNWRSQPGLYNATCKKKKLTITTDKMEPKIKKAKGTKTKKQTNGYKPRNQAKATLKTKRGYTHQNHPFLIEELNKITVKKFEIALNYWTMHLNFSDDITATLNNLKPGAAYDESRYPNPANKPRRVHSQKNQQQVPTSTKRNHALTFAL
jgi:hypothetical protein